MLLVDFPSIVKKYAPFFKVCFSEAHYEHFKKAVSGFMISDNKTLEGMNRIFVNDSKDQSTFNRFFNSENFDLEQINEQRLQMLQQFSQTQFKTHKRCNGVLSVDNSLLKHYGKKIDNIYYHFDYVHKCYRWSHDLVTLYYSDNETDYPVYHQLWMPPDWEAVAEFFKAKNFTINQTKWDNRTKEAQKWRNYIRSRYKDGRKKHPEVKKIYKTKVHLAEDLIRKFCATYPHLKYPIALDAGFTSAELCAVITEELKRDYIGTLQEKQSIIDKKDGTKIPLKDLVARLRKQHLTTPTESKIKHIKYNYRGQEQSCYAYCENHHINGFKKKQRLVISFLKKDLTDMPKFTIVNRTDWHPVSILQNRRHRWPVETFHQEGKAEGLEKYQVRNFRAVQTYIALVIVTFCMLKCAIQDDELGSEIQQRLQTETDGTLPYLRRLMKAEGLLQLIEYVFVKIKNGNSLASIYQPLAQRVAYQ